jgi:hypothetical protein
MVESGDPASSVPMTRRASSRRSGEKGMLQASRRRMALTDGVSQ